ncbi:MAG: sigma 54-interacting transcriptional regulator [Pseudomonadota bacterium]
MYQLICSKDKKSLMKIPLVKKQFKVGRAIDNDLVLCDREISRYQFEIHKEYDAYYLQNLSNRNYTRLNDNCDDRQKIEPGNVIAVGDWKILFSLLQFETTQSVEETRVFDLGNELKKKRNNFRNKKIIYQSKCMKKLLSSLEIIAKSDISVLIQGETGVGKELVASYIYQNSKRYRKKFISINCACIASELVESELFGHERGSFTSAINQKKGLFEEVDDGTIFLDEIGEIPLSLQIKLLRVLENNEIRKIGSNKLQYVDVRVVAATNIDLLSQVEKGEFRKDLYYRLNQFPITVPPLRNRVKDIEILINHFLNTDPILESKKNIKVHQDTLEFLKEYTFPGNVRELKNCLRRAVLNSFSSKVLLPKDFNFLIKEEQLIDSSKEIITIKALEKEAILKALKSLNGNKKKTAGVLGLGLSTLYTKMNEYSIR